MKKIVFLLNRTYVSFLHVISFLAFLSIQIKILSLSEFYNIIMKSSGTAYTILIVFSAVSILFTRLLIHLLQKLQQHQLD